MFGKVNDRPSVAQEDYIRAISKMQEGPEPVTVSALAATIGVTAPSVSGMLQRLVSDGLVDHQPRAGIRLSRRGHQMAMAVHRRHRLVETFLVDVLGLDWSEVHEEAEALEHHLSDRLVRAIDRYLGHPKVDPHGHPIPSPDGTVIARNLEPLESLGPGETAVIREVRSDEPGRIRLWKDLGLVPGALVRVVEHRPVDGVWLLDVSGRRVTTGQPGVDGLRVEKIG